MSTTPPGSVSPGGTDPTGVDRAARLVPRSGRFVVAVDGVDGAGKTTFADALAALLRRRGDAVERASIDGFHHPLAHRRAEGRTAEAVWSRHFDYEALRRDLLDPWRAGPGSSYRTAVHDVFTDETLDLPRRPVPTSGVLVVDGLFCQRPELEGCWDAVVFLDVPFPVSVARMARRDGGSPDPDHPDQRRYVDAQRHYLETCRPRERADLVVDHR
jgi:uridine kinase